MDPISVISSITTVLQLAGSVVKFLSDVIDAPVACNRILVEVSSINGILSSIKSLVDGAESGEAWIATLRSLSAPNGPLPQFKLALEQVRACIKPTIGLVNLGNAFVWPFKKGEVMDILHNLERQKTLFILALENDHIELSRAIRKEIHQISNRVAQLQVDQERQEIRFRNQEHEDLLAWLSPLSFWAKQNDVFSRRQEGTGQWLLKTNLFKAWLGGTEKTLWCPGIPGAGKTVLASIIVNYLEQAFKQNVIVAYIYCNYKEQNQTAINLAASLLQQIVQGQPVVSDDIITIYNQHRRKQTRPSLAEYLKLLQSEIHHFSKVFIVIDALDECLDREGIRSFLPELQKLPPNTHLLVTSRYIRDIEHEFEKAARLEIYARDEDVKSYVEARMGEQHQLVRHIEADPTLRSTISDAIVQKANGMFLLAQLHMDSLAKEDNRRAVRRALQNLPNELNGTYDEAMKRIQGQEWRKVKRAEQVLSWISHAVGQLTVKEIRYALAVEPDDTDMDEEALPDEDLLISACAGLVTIDRESNVIRLVHYTAQEYLERNRKNLFPTAETDIARTCLTYLSFDIFADGCCPSDDGMKLRLQENPFLFYAAHYWGHHARGAPEQNQVIKKLILKFLKQDSKVACSTQVRYIPQIQYMWYSQHFPKDVSGLQVAASFGLKEIVRTLMENKADPEAKDSNGMTCLHSAASNGHKEVVELLLEKGVDIETKDNDGMMALHWAASEGREEVVEALLERKADIDAKTAFGKTALYLAALKGHQEVTRLLLEGRADPNLRESKHGHTPLSQAAWNGHDVVVRLLLEHGADPNSKDMEYGMTPLSLAALHGHATVVRLLLSQDSVEPDSKDNYGRTALCHAVRQGREAAARVLLERNDVDPESKDMWNRTPLWRAEENGHESLVRLLAPTTSTHSDGSLHQPLLLAAEVGDEAAVRLLLEGDCADINIRSRNGQTPLSYASRNGHDAIVQLLLEHDSVDLESKCTFGRTPLSWAAENGHDTIVDRLLKKGANPDSKSANGRTPLLYAARLGREAVVRLLLEQDGVDLNSRDDEWITTPLGWAAESGREAVVRLLLEKGADVEAKSLNGLTPLNLAAYEGHEATVLLLKSRIQSS